MFFQRTLGSGNAQGNGSRGNLNTDLKSKDLIWANKDIFAKRSLVACKGMILEFTLHGFTFFMLEKVASFMFFIGSKKHTSFCSPNQISRNFLIAASSKVSASNISLVTFSFATTPVDIHINGRGLKVSMIVVSSIFKNCRQHLDLSLLLMDSSQDVYTFGYCNLNAYEKLFEYLLYKHNLSPIV